MREWASSKEASLATGTSISSISRSCIGNQKLGNGYIWRYKEEVFTDIRPVDIPGFERVFATEKGRIIGKTGKVSYGSNITGYLATSIKSVSDGVRHQKLVHRLVAWAFYGPDNGRMVNHKNGIKTDNRPENLEYVTGQQNMIHAYATGLIDVTKRYKSIIRISPITGEITGYYDSLTQAGIENNLNISSISSACNDVKGYFAGYKWRYGNNLEWKEKLEQFLLRPKRLVLNVVIQ